MDISRASKKLSWLLRHGAEESRLSMDPAGWSSIDDVLRIARITREELDIVVRENNKNRLQVKNGLIRACQGHSLRGMPVTLDALEASWERWEGDRSLWHGTSTGAAHSIARDKINAGDRTHVHLAETVDSKVGKRAGVDVLLEISPTRLHAVGLGVFRSPNGVLLVREVPAQCIVGVRGMTTAGKREETALRTVFAAVKVS